MRHFIFIIIIIDARIASANNKKGAIIIYALLIWKYKKTVYSIISRRRRLCEDLCGSLTFCMANTILK